MRLLGFITLLLFLFLAGGVKAASSEKNATFAMESLQDSLAWADYYYNVHRYKKAISIYEKSLENQGADKPHILKKLALSHAAIENPEASLSNVYAYLFLDFNPSFLAHEGFDNIREDEGFKKLSEAIVPKITFWVVLYLFVALVGFYVIALILLNRKIRPVAGYLIGAFIFIHSIFILNIAVNRANYLFDFPHFYLISTWAIFLYGPLLYFYFKRTTQRYSFRKWDLLHLLPTVILLGFLIPQVYAISGSEKIALMLTRLQYGVAPHDSNKLTLLVVLKIISLVAYGYFIHKVYRSSKKREDFDPISKTWQKNIYHLHISYVLIYAVYGIIIINGQPSGILFHASVAAMAVMVLYVGYSANIQPQVFSGAYSYVNRLFPKYEKSGLTTSLSHELKDKVEYLFSKEKLYKENNINLDMLAERLNTTRHNASQVINEHFDMSFHELVNKYRISEAKQLLEDDSKLNWNIIEVAYEVGYNNKVTFNKAFKKDTNLTPSEYQKNSWGA